MSADASASVRPRFAAAFAALLVVAGCAAAPEAEGIASTREDREMFVSGFEDIESVYIDPVDIAQLTVAGLRNLATIDPKLGVSTPSGEIVLLVDGKPRRMIPTPTSGDPASWGVVAARTLAAARLESSSIRAASSEALYDAVFTGVMGDLDEFSRYASASEAEEQRASREGFGGVGIRIAAEEEQIRIQSVMHYTPAERAGLKADDVIIEVDGRSLQGMDQEAVVAMLRGRIGTPVMIKVVRPGVEKPLLVEVVRAHIVPETVTYRREGDAAYIRIHSFNLDTAHSLEREIENARREIGPRLRGYILDLRGNPGGILDQAVEVADLFLEKGAIVSTHGRHPDSHQYFEATSGDIAQGEPIVVLINGYSASAAEIVAAALQDSGRAAVIGTNSYGKGTVQHLQRMPNNGELILTWARFHAPSGYTLNHLGVLPSICTNDLDRGTAPVLAALRAGTLRPVPTVLRNATDPGDEAALNRLRAACPVNNRERPAELQLALQILAEPSLYRQAVHLAGAQQQAASSGQTQP